MLTKKLAPYIDKAKPENKPRWVLNSTNHNPQKWTLCRPFEFDVMLFVRTPDLPRARFWTPLLHSFKENAQDDIQKIQV